MKSRENQRALLLRKNGFSLNEISKSLGVSKSSVSLWVRGIELSKEAQKSIFLKRKIAREKSAQTHRANTIRKLNIANQSALKTLAGVHLTPDTSRLICALLYWCEGEKLKQGGKFTFTNSDPALVSMFLKLLRSGFDIDESKLRLTLHLHEYHDSVTQLRFWSKVTRIPLSQSHRPYRKPHTGKHTRKGYPGCAAVSYFDIDTGRRVEAIAKAFLAQQGD